MLRAQLTGRVCHRVNDEASAKMALGGIADSSGGWSRIRTPYLSLADAAAICRETADLSPDVTALEPFRPHALASPVTAPVPAAKPHPATG